jgi:hypothetical protein
MIAVSTAISGTTVTGTLQSKRLAIDAQGVSHIATILQDTLYTDKILAPIREYSTNAMDAHVEAGKPNEPILVKLPNRFNPVFAVRDFGFGMDDHRVWQVFCNYGSSTKRETNEQVGMLGIGSKSAFAYPNCKSFTVISFQKGMKKSFVCHKGGCSEGELVQLAEEPTTEPDGLEIQIPVSINDINEFVSRANKFFAHWEVMPRFEGAQITIQKAERIFSGKDWYITENDGYSRGGIHVLMGNISYAVGNTNTLRISDQNLPLGENDAYRRLFESNLVIKMPIGTVDIAANRESLQMTDKTITAIWEKLKTVRTEIGGELEKKFIGLNTLWDKACLRSKFSSYGTSYSSFAPFLPAHIKSIPTHFPLNDEGFNCTVYSRSHRGNRRVRTTGYGAWTIEASESRCVIINYDPAKYQTKEITKRVVALIERDTNQFKKAFHTVSVLNVSDKVKFAAWKAKTGFDFPEVTVDSLPSYKLSEFYPSLKKSTGVSVNADKNSKRYLTVDFSQTSMYNKASYFTDVTLPKKPADPIPYIVIDRYEIQVKRKDGNGDNYISPNDFVLSVNELAKRFNIKIPTTVAVKQSLSAKIAGDTRFVSFWKYISDKLKCNKEFLAETLNWELTNKFLFISGNNSYAYNFSYTSSEVLDLRLVRGQLPYIDSFDKNGNFYKLLDEYRKIKDMFAANGKSRLRFNSVLVSILASEQNGVFNNTLKSAGDIYNKFSNAVAAVAKDYSLIRYIDGSIGSVVEKDVLNYIRLVDSYPKMKKLIDNNQ